MIDETNNNAEGWAQDPISAPETPTLYCQDCGKPLAPGEERRIGSSIFCDPCLARRTAVPPPPANAVPGAIPPTGHIPNPTVAGWIAMFPGAGQMYNGQVAKGFAVLLIFIVLSSFKEHVSDIFGLLCFGWWVFGIVDAVQTARARRDGLPLPNHFDLNNIGEKIGHPSHWHTAANPPHTNPYQAPVAETAPPASPWAPVPPVPPVPPLNPALQSNWAGYVPPTAFGGNTPYAQQPYTAPQPNAVPYAPTYGTETPSAVPPPDHHRFPVVAIVLIGAGILFLLANFIPSIHFSGSWVTAIVLLFATGLTLIKRVAVAERIRETSGVSQAYVSLHVFRLPIVLGLLSVLFVLQALHIRDLDSTWPFILIVFGGLVLADRAMAPRVLPPTAWPVNPAAPPAPIATPTEVHHE